MPQLPEYQKPAQSCRVRSRRVQARTTVGRELPVLASSIVKWVPRGEAHLKCSAHLGLITPEITPPSLPDGTIHLFPLDGAVAALEDLITCQLRGDTTLRLAWERFALYDTNAIRQQISASRLQWWIQVVGQASSRKDEADNGVDSASQDILRHFSYA